MREQRAELRQAEGCRRDGRRRIRPSKEVSQAVRRRSPAGMPQTRREAAFVGSVVPPFWGARPGRLSATRSKSDERRRRPQRQAVQHHARSRRLSSTELRSGPNGSIPKERSAGAAAASYRRHGSRRYECIRWQTSPSGLPRSRRQQVPTRPRPRRRSTGGRSAADGSRQRTRRRRERRRSRRCHRRLKRRRRRSLVLLRARHGRLRD